MKLRTDTKGAISTTMIILAILAVAVIGLAYMGMTPSEDVDADVSVNETAAGKETGSFELNFADIAGTAVNDTQGIIIYLTSPDVYADVYAAYTEFDDEGDLVGPYDVADIAGAKKSALSSAGVVSFSVTAGQYIADSDVNMGTDFGVVAIDESASDLAMVAGDYNPEVGKIKINCRLNPDLDVVVTVVENLPGYLGADIELAEIGVLEFFDDLTDNAVTGYNMNSTIADDIDNEDFTIYARLNAEDTEIRDIAVYMDLDDGNMTLEVDDIEIVVDDVKISGTSLTEVADLDSADPLKDNAPTKVGDDVYVVEGSSVDMDRINDNNMVELEITLSDYSTATITENMTGGSVLIKLVGLSGHEDTAITLGTFTFSIAESIASPGYIDA